MFLFIVVSIGLVFTYIILKKRESDLIMVAYIQGYEDSLSDNDDTRETRPVRHLESV